MDNNIPLCLPQISEDDIGLVNEVLRSGWLAHGPYNDQFESDFARFVGTEYALSLNSCTSALELALWASGIKGEVIIPSFTWCSTGNVVALQGAEIVFADIDPDTLCLDISDVKRKITDRTEAIILVHYAGLCSDLVEFKNLADEAGVLLIEDSAEAIGAVCSGHVSGSMGVGCFSFYPTKNMTTCEGGMLTTNSKELYLRCKELSAHGVSKSAADRESLVAKEKWHREAIVNGRNFRMPNPLAAMGVSQLRRLNAMNEARRAIAKRYRSAFEGVKGIRMQAEPINTTHVYQMFPILVDNKVPLINELNGKGIMASSHFDPPLHRQQAFLDVSAGALPVTEDVAGSVVTLPIYPDMTPEMVETVISEVIAHLG
jgi:perosamine synthetase